MISPAWAQQKRMLIHHRSRNHSCRARMACSHPRGMPAKPVGRPTASMLPSRLVSARTGWMAESMRPSFLPNCLHPQSCLPAQDDGCARHERESLRLHLLTARWWCLGARRSLLRHLRWILFLLEAATPPRPGREDPVVQMALHRPQALLPLPTHQTKVLHLQRQIPVVVLLVIPKRPVTIVSL